MACNLSAGRAVPCKDVVGGIQKVFFVDFGGLGAITYTDDEISDADGTFSAYEYDLKGADMANKGTGPDEAEAGKPTADDSMGVAAEKSTADAAMEPEGWPEPKMIAFAISIV